MEAAHQATSAVNQTMEAEQLLAQIAGLSQALEEANPDISTYVKQIHRNLIQYPELVHILKPEQVQVVVKGVMQTNGEQILAATKAKKPKRESLADLLAGI